MWSTLLRVYQAFTGWLKCAALTYNSVSGGKWEWISQGDPYWAGECMHCASNPRWVGVLVCGGWEHGCRESCPGPPCSQCISEVWILLLLLLCNMVQIFACSHTLEEQTEVLCIFSFRSKNIPFPLGVWNQQTKLLMVQSFVSTTARKGKSLQSVLWGRRSSLHQLHPFKVVFPLENLCDSAMWQIDRNPIFLDI